ncbi:hypothetical protein QWY14_07760 [Planococcus sp. N028]|uniref:Uncharacterized protein n=1 Tax=Planococcus shixiaomingii TaxID=3058393 RepID=A0ABT8N2A3_9BACL|nr:hypothetical protein [Planococcus sp. N028]MDN7241685.1 hypothetical protein [Planococcus sp. N028]
MMISMGMFTILIWVSILGSALLMLTIFGYFLYELRKNKIW